MSTQNAGADIKTTETVSSALVGLLEDLGVEYAFGIVGGAIAPFAEALERSRVRVVHCRHEAGAAFAAAEASIACDRPAMVFTTTGPGVLNALTGLSAARWEGARVLLIAGATAAEQRGRWACQETSPHTMSAMLSSGPIFDYALTIESPAELEGLARRLTMGFARPSGFVAHVGLPFARQRELRAPVVHSAELRPAGCDQSSAAECARLFRDRSAVLWVGFGARGAADAVRRLAERLDAPVMCSPRGKGIMPEDHPLFLGVTGLGGHSRVSEYLHHQPPDHILVLGTRLGELTSFWRTELAPRRSFVHVDVDPAVPGAAYPRAATLGIQAEIGAFLRALLVHLPEKDRPAKRLFPRVSPAPITASIEGRVRPQYLMQELQRIVVDGSDAIVMTEAGNALVWGNYHLRFQTAGRYRVSTGFGSMGHFTAGVVGAALAGRRPAVAIVGDGAMLMNNEVNTAVAERVPAIWVVLNDSRYGMIHQGMIGLGLAPSNAELPHTNFAATAVAMGARGLRVTRETEVAEALTTALGDGGPVVVDVEIDREQIAPHEARIASLSKHEE